MKDGQKIIVSQLFTRSFWQYLRIAFAFSPAIQFQKLVYFSSSRAFYRIFGNEGRSEHSFPSFEIDN